MREALAKARTTLEQSEAESSRLREQSAERLSPTQVKTLLGDDFAAAQQISDHTSAARCPATARSRMRAGHSKGLCCSIITVAEKTKAGIAKAVQAV